MRLPDAATPLLTALEHLLRGQIEAHQQLLICLDRKREAVRTAKIDLVAAVCEEERLIVNRIAEMETQRVELVRRIVETSKRRNVETSKSNAPHPRAGALADPVPFSAIIELVGDHARERLEALATELREVVTEVRRRSSIVRAAAESLARHMSGVMQTVHSALSRAGVYGRRGHSEVGAQLEYSVDLRT